MLELPDRLHHHPDEEGARVLLALEDPAEVERARTWLTEAGYAVSVASDPAGAARLVSERLDLDVVVVDWRFARGPDGVLAELEGAPTGLGVVLTGPKDVFVATEILASGGSSYLSHPLDQGDLLGEVLRALRGAREALRSEEVRLTLPAEVRFEGLVGSTPRMQDVMDLLRKAAPTDVPVVILGESGTGKELVARAIHHSSPRRNGPFVALHLHATPSGVLESELFGHKKGAFTGAHADRVGKLELAHGGTLFLDELGDIPLETQTKLLRVLETRTFEPVGSNRPVTSDFRLIAATNQDIEAMIADKRFREELWFRLKVVQVELPPLRERRGDIPPLVEHFVRDYAAQYGKRIEGVDPEAMALLRRYAWPGNIRELRNVVQHMVVLADGPRIGARQVPRALRGGEEPGEVAPAAALGGGTLAGRTMDDIEREAIRQTLQLTDGNRKAAADLLQIGERTLYRKIEKYGL